MPLLILPRGDLERATRRCHGSYLVRQREAVEHGRERIRRQLGDELRRLRHGCARLAELSILRVWRATAVRKMTDADIQKAYADARAAAFAPAAAVVAAAAARR